MMRTCGLVNAFVLGGSVVNGIWPLAVLALFNMVCCGYIAWRDAGTVDVY